MIRRLLLGAGLLAVVAVYAQQAGFTRKMLQDHDVAATDRHAVQVLVEFVPGGAVGKHTHPGEELGYVVEGTLELQVVGQPPRTVKAGEAFFVPAGVVHEGRNTGAGTAKVLATYIAEKGKPLATPVAP
jgi:quercetin dioxygenase-like cupin family protein